MKKNINQQAIAIQKRFFEAIDLAIESGTLTCGLKGFCSDHGLNRVKYSNIKNDLKRNDEVVKPHTYKVIDIDALAYICHDLSVSPEWLLFGRGKMFS